MIGQKELVAKLKSYSIATLPHTILLVGERGCGKHTLIKELETFYNMSAFDITETISFESIQEIMNNPVNHFYVIDMTKVNEKQQNIILKFLEEPSRTTYIILTTTSKSILLDTVINRCATFEFAPYSKDELMQFLPFTDNIEMLVEYCHTPGQINSTSVSAVNELIELSDNIINNIGKARFPNILKISQKCKGLDIDLLYQVLMERLVSKFKQDSTMLYRDMYLATSQYLKKHNDPRLNQEMLIDSLMIELRAIARGYMQ